MIPDQTNSLLNRAHDHMTEAISLMRGSNMFFNGSEVWNRISWRRGRAYNIMKHMANPRHGLIYLRKLNNKGRFSKAQCSAVGDIARMVLATYDTRGGHYDFWARLFAAAENEQHIVEYHTT